MSSKSCSSVYTIRRIYPSPTPPLTGSGGAEDICSYVIMSSKSLSSVFSMRWVAPLPQPLPLQGRWERCMFVCYYVFQIPFVCLQLAVGCTPPPTPPLTGAGGAVYVRMLLCLPNPVSMSFNYVLLLFCLQQVICLSTVLFLKLCKTLRGLGENSP